MNLGNKRQTLIIAASCGLLLLGGGGYWLNERLSSSSSDVKVVAAPVKSAGKKTDTKAVPSKVLLETQGILPAAAGQYPWLDELTGLQVDPGASFSLQQWQSEVMKKKKVQASNDALSQAAVMMYESALKLGLQIGERRAHLNLPDYAVLGFDAAFIVDQQDFSFLNPYSFPITWKIDYRNNHAVLTASGPADSNWKLPLITVTTEDLASDKVVLEDSKVKGESVEQKGQQGMLVKVVDGTTDAEHPKLLVKDVYLSKETVVHRPPEQPRASGATNSGSISSPIVIPNPAAGVNSGVNTAPAINPSPSSPIAVDPSSKASNWSTSNSQETTEKLPEITITTN